jgi:predicted deacylase
MDQPFKNQNLQSLTFLNHLVKSGESKRIEMPVSEQLMQGTVSIPLHVAYGKKPGPTICLTATLHGDEICGIEIIRQVLCEINPKKLKGIIIFVPVVNVFGFNHNSRYLPDRRDLNRCFPGSKRGSMAARLANLYITQVIEKCDYAIDFHTAAMGKTNYPQVRANLENKAIYEFAKSFNSPVMIHSKEIHGSLREAAQKVNCKMIVFESGEVNRFDQDSIRVAVDGIFHVLHEMKMMKSKRKIKTIRPKEFKKMKWLRAPKSGLFHTLHLLGSVVKDKETIGEISDIFGDTIAKVKAPCGGMIVGITTNPKVHQGDAIVHIACAAKNF